MSHKSSKTLQSKMLEIMHMRKNVYFYLIQSKSFVILFGHKAISCLEDPVPPVQNISFLGMEWNI